MTEWTLNVSVTTMVLNTVLQGFGLGFVFIPLQVIAFATLDPAPRTEGTGLISLTRNVGSAIGISVTGAMITRNGRVEHSVLSGFITPFRRLPRTARRCWTRSSPGKPISSPITTIGC